MKNKFQVLTALFLCLVTVPGWSVTINKAKPVEKKQTAATDSAASLVPTVLGLVSSVQQLNAKQTEMTAECTPSAQEIRFVNDLVKEWAKVGTSTADKAFTALGMRKCQSTESYELNMKTYAGTDTKDMFCADFFAEENSIWNGYPKASIATYCEGGVDVCKSKKTASNIYSVFALVDFNKKDYITTEATMAAKLIDKMEKCSDAKLSAKKREMWGSFLMDTVGGMGQSTNTGAIMQQVQSSVGASGGGLGSLGSLGSMVTNFMQ